MARKLTARGKVRLTFLPCSRPSSPQDQIRKVVAFHASPVRSSTVPHTRWLQPRQMQTQGDFSFDQINQRALNVLICWNEAIGRLQSRSAACGLSKNKLEEAFFQFPLVAQGHSMCEARLEHLFQKIPKAPYASCSSYRSPSSKELSYSTRQIRTARLPSCHESPNLPVLHT